MTLLGDLTQLTVIPPDESPVARTLYPAIAAHRGGLARYPEGTITAFRAITQSHPGMILEMDARPLADGTLVICHDATVDRIADGSTGTLANMTLAQWRALRIKDPVGGPSVPAATLADVLNEFGGTNIVLMIELKDYSAAARNEYVRQCWPYRKQIISACYEPNVNRVLSGSGFYGQQLGSAVPSTYADGMQCVALNHKNITAQVVRDVHLRGSKLWAWTVNDTTTKNQMLSMGVDGIITDNPNI